MSTPTERDQQIAILAVQGTPNTEIARRVGVHYNTVARILKRPEIQALIAELRQETQALVVEKVAKTMAERMDEAAEEAFDTLTGLVRGAKSETVQLKAVESVLDRSPTAPKRQIHSHSTVETESKVIRITLTAADIAQLKLGMIDEDEIGDMIDVTPQPVRPVREIIAELEAARGAEH